MPDFKSEKLPDGDLPVIFALDTSSKLTSLAITRGARLIAQFGAELDDKRSARLWDVIAFLFDSTGMKIEEVTLFAACAGPGGYTGLRVGIAAAKGFASALDRLTIGITSLEARAAGAKSTGQVCVLSNAYKGEVYSQLFTVNERGVPVAGNEPLVSGIEQAVQRVSEIDDLIFTGDAVTRNDEGFAEDVAGKGWTVKEGSPFLAEQVARLAFFKMAEAVRPEDLQACYVRPPDIKIKPQVP